MPNPAADPGVNHDRPALLIVGASTRAAAHSAIRGGLRPVCVDLFADRDLRSTAQTISVPAFPDGVPEAVRPLPEHDWMFTGGLENRGEIVWRISSRHRLLGTKGESLSRIRDPHWLGEVLRSASLPALEVRASGQSPREDGTWLRKPLGGAGGRGICLWDGEVQEADEPYYFQKRAAGSSVSAQFLATPGATELLGVTRQLVGLRGVHAPPFAWCGNIYPAEIAAETVETMTAIGRALAVAADLRGLFGCDFIVSAGVPWLTEVNPRYTASMELIEHRVGHSLVARHVTACSAYEDASSGVSSGADQSKFWHSSTRRAGVIGKIVVYADQDLMTEDASALLLGPLDDRLPFVADVPDPGQTIPAGHPVCTLFTTERQEDACIARLLRCAKRFRHRFLRPLSERRG